MTVSRPRALRARTLILLLLAAGSLVGCGERGEPLRSTHPGYPVYRKTCRRCHGNEGDGARAARMAEHAVDLAAPAFRDTVDAAWIERVVRLGKGRMKGYEETLTDSEIEGLVDYVLGLSDARAEARRKAASEAPAR